MKIIIKSDCTRMKTSNINLAMTVLIGLKVENKLTDDDAIDEATRALINKVQENFETPDIAPVEKAGEELDKAIDEHKEIKGGILRATASTTTPKKNKKSRYTHAAWTEEEDAEVIKGLHLEPSELCKSDILKARHSKYAIKTRLSVIKNRNFKKFPPKRRKFIKKLMDNGYNAQQGYKENPSSKDIANGIIEPPKRKYTKKGKTVNFWTPAEVADLKENIDRPIPAIMEILPNRSREAIIFKRNVLNGKKYVKRNKKNAPKEYAVTISNGTSKRGGKRKGWTPKEEGFFLDNLGKVKTKELIEAPELAKRSPGAVYARVSAINKKKENKLNPAFVEQLKERNLW